MRFSLLSRMRRWIRSLTGRVMHPITSRAAIGLKKSAKAKLMRASIA
jgi:hypothetical protein